MYRTERYWATLALSGFFGCLGFVLGQPVFFLCTAGLLAWLLVVEAIVRSRRSRVQELLSIAYLPSQRTVRPEQPVNLVTSLSVPRPLGFSVSVSPGYPETAHGTPDSNIALDADVTELETECELTFPYAGRYDVGPGTVHIHGPYGLVSSEVSVGEQESVTVEPQSPEGVHVGQAGERFAVALGEHGSQGTGTGMDPAGVRPYTPSDPASRINWKTTARLDDVYVREFEIETTRPLLLVMDGRATPNSMEDTPQAYLGHVASALVADAASHGDPVGFYYVTDDGVEVSPNLRADAEHYLAVRNRIYDASRRTNGDPPETTESAGVGHPVGQQAGVADRLRGDDSAFGRRLAPFFRPSSDQRQFRRIETEPLREATRTFLERHARGVRVAILTSDTNRTELYETVRLVGRLSPEVLVFVAPTALFEVPEFADIERLYERYAEFERYRGRLDSIENVAAFEVAPGDKLDALLAHRRRNARR